MASSPASSDGQRLFEFFKRIAPLHPEMADFLCPISRQIMTDPVRAEDGFNYQRHFIEHWLLCESKSPTTGLPMGKKTELNGSLASAIAKFRTHFIEGAAETTIEWDPHGRQRRGQKRQITLKRIPSVKQEVKDEAVEAAVPPAKRQRTDANSERTDLSQALGRVFQYLDPLRDLLRSVLEGWTPPKVIVIGDESAGKSTVLEMLAMMAVFPRKRRFCTKAAIHLRLRRDVSFKATICIYDVSADGQEVAVGAPQQMPQENGWRWVQEEMERLVTELSAQALASHGIVREKIIVLQVHRPDVPSIDLVDLPGLTAVPKEKAIEVESILKKHLDDDKRSGGHGMFLAIVPARVRPNTNAAMRFVQEHQLEKKTIGVFTKCDQLDEGDEDTLCSLLTGEPTRDGEPAKSSGAVELEQGWVATMLKPPADPLYEVHNFERILRQQGNEAEFWSQTLAYAEKKLVSRRLVGVDALVHHAEDKYFEYLNSTWKKSAMEKILVKLDDKEFARNMLGVVEKDKRDKLAREEVMRRVGAGSPVEKLRQEFRTKFVLTDLCGIVRSTLEPLKDSTVDEWEVDEKLTDAGKALFHAVKSKVLDNVTDYWTQHLRSILTQENKVIEDEGNAAESNIAFDFAAAASTFVRVRLFKKGKPKYRLREELKQKPLIQLVHYTAFTDRIIEECKELFDNAVEALENSIDLLCQRLADPDSPWLEQMPLLLQQQAGPDAAANGKINVKCDVEKFLSVLVSVFLRAIPSPNKLQKIHENIEVGEEKGEARERYEALSEEIRLIEQARDGICKAFAISTEELEEMKKQSDTSV